MKAVHTAIHRVVVIINQLFEVVRFENQSHDQDTCSRQDSDLDCLAARGQDRWSPVPPAATAGWCRGRDVPERCLRTTSFDTHLSWSGDRDELFCAHCTVNRRMPVSSFRVRSHESMGEFWLSTGSSTFSMFSLTRTLPGCRSVVPARLPFGFSLTKCRYFHILSTCYEPVWQILHCFDWENLRVNKILCNVVYSQNNMLLNRAKSVIVLCSVISQGKAVALDRWGGN